MVFALCPGQVNPNRPLDYTQAADVKLYKAATEPFNKDKPFDVESAGLMQFMMEVHNCAIENGWTDPEHPKAV
jgi:intein-encoded DNA endonuclease-like protein